MTHPGTPILHVGQLRARHGRASTSSSICRAPSCPTAHYPLLLTTGRVLYHWHGGEMTRRSRGLLAVYPGALVEISPEDARTDRSEGR